MKHGRVSDSEAELNEFKAHELPRYTLEKKQTAPAEPNRRPTGVVLIPDSMRLALEQLKAKYR